MLRKYGDHQPYHILKYRDKLNECKLKREKKKKTEMARQ